MSMDKEEARQKVTEESNTNQQAVYEAMNEYLSVHPVSVASALRRCLPHIDVEARDGVYDVIVALENVHEEDVEVNRRTGSSYP